ncbi:hypothetical protein AB0F43_06205 [Kribbella sp. NPDC023972]|uniref:hypothetical protein n=1 Tax=Kribbella sp. NPDC023972 TaxID=3154795 RepID=UPI0033DD6677
MFTVYGAIAVTELTIRADTAQDFLRTGVPAVADPVTFNVGLGKGAPFLRDVQVKFKSADQQSIQTALSWIDADTPIPRNEERQTPDPGTRYAPPLRILYLPDDPHTAIAEADAQRLVDNRDKYRGWAAACLGVGIASLAALVILLVRQDRASRPNPRLR